MGYVSVMESEGVGFNGRVYTVLAKLYFAQRDWKAALALLQARHTSTSRDVTQSHQQRVDGGAAALFCV